MKNRRTKTKRIIRAIQLRRGRDSFRYFLKPKKHGCIRSRYTHGNCIGTSAAKVTHIARIIPIIIIFNACAVCAADEYLIFYYCYFFFFCSLVHAIPISEGRIYIYIYVRTCRYAAMVENCITSARRSLYVSLTHLPYEWTYTSVADSNPKKKTPLLRHRRTKNRYKRVSNGNNFRVSGFSYRLCRVMYRSRFFFRRDRFCLLASGIRLVRVRVHDGFRFCQLRVPSLPPPPHQTIERGHQHKRTTRVWFRNLRCCGGGTISISLPPPRLKI